MIVRLLILVFLLSIPFLNACFGQPTSDRLSGYQQKENLFREGIHIQNLNLLIPWGTKYPEILKLGNPEITCQLKTNTRVRWNSVLILDSLYIDFWCFYHGCFLKKKPTGEFEEIYSSIDSTDLNKLKNYFEQYTKQEGYAYKKRDNRFFYQWTIDDCNVRIGYNRVDKAYLRIQKR